MILNSIYILFSFFIIFPPFWKKEQEHNRRMINGILLEYSCTYFNEKKIWRDENNLKPLRGMLEIYSWCEHCFSYEISRLEKRRRKGKRNTITAGCSHFSGWLLFYVFWIKQSAISISYCINRYFSLHYVVRSFYLISRNRLLFLIIASARHPRSQ